MLDRVMTTGAGAGASMDRLGYSLIRCAARSSAKRRTVAAASVTCSELSQCNVTSSSALSVRRATSGRSRVSTHKCTKIVAAATVFWFTNQLTQEIPLGNVRGETDEEVEHPVLLALDVVEEHVCNGTDLADPTAHSQAVVHQPLHHQVLAMTYYFFQ
eukprot:PhM_4_TR2843/c0_g1_i1/m.36955